MRNRLERISLAFFIPAIVVFFIFVGWPAINTFRMSVLDFSLLRGFSGSEFVGMANFREFFNSPLLSEIFRNSLIFFVVPTLLAMVVAIPAAIAVGSMKKGVTRSAATVGLLLPAFVPDVLIAFTALSRTPSFMFAEPSSFRLGIILLSAISPATVYAFVGACAAGIYNDRGKNALHGALAGVFIGVAVSLVRFLSTNLELHLLLQNPFVFSVGNTFDTFAHNRGLISFQFAMASTSWVVKTVLQILMAIGVSFAVFAVARSGTKDGTAYERVERDEFDNENIGKTLPGMLFAIVFVVASFLPLAFTGSNGNEFGTGIGNSIFMTVVSAILFGGFAFLLAMGVSARLHKRGTLMLVLLLVAFTNNVVSEFLHYRNMGALDTYWAVILSGAFNITFILPLAYLARLKEPNVTKMGALVRNLLPYLIAFCGLFVATTWGEYFRQIILLQSRSNFGVSMMLRDTMFFGEDGVTAGLILSVVLPVLVVAVVTVVGFVVTDKTNVPLKEIEIEEEEAPCNM